MIKTNHLKQLPVLLPAVLFAASFLVFSCNNESKTETKASDSVVVKPDTVMPADNTNMMQDTLVKDTSKGEQTPPPK